MRRAALVAAIALVAACSSSEEQLNPQPLPPEDQGARDPNQNGTAGASPSFGTCTGTCCEKPAEGSACDANADTTCSWALTCPSGLVIPYEIKCDGGVWKLTNGCPAEGAVDARGCPAREPENGTPCSLTSGTTQCGYVLQCPAYRKSVLATCVNDAWQATPLGPCD
jgi:hypothetical protein